VKTCTKCGVEKDDEAFSLRADSGKRRDECKPCRAETMREKRDETPERHLLVLMLQRCHNPRHPKFHLYGGCGIAVADEWHGPEGFASFRAHIGPRPSLKHSVDRIDNAKGYEPGNVRWATQSEQMRNTRCTTAITIDGVTRCRTEWSEVSGVGSSLIRARQKLGWSDRDAVFKPVARQSRAA
jgi:hypothetical protein